MQRTWWPEAGTIIVTGPYSCSGKWHLLPYLVVPLISTRVSAHCQAILLTTESMMVQVVAYDHPETNTPIPQTLLTQII